MPRPSEPGNSRALSQASENARVIVPLLQETSAKRRKCAEFLLFFLCGSRIANRCSSALNPPFRVFFNNSTFWGNCLFWFVAVLLVVLLAGVLGFAHVAIASIGIARFSSSRSSFCFLWLFWDTSSVAPKQSSNRIYRRSAASAPR